MKSAQAFEELIRVRDEARLKFRLLTLDARSKWRALEDKMDELEDKVTSEAWVPEAARGQIEEIVRNARDLLRQTRKVSTAKDLMSRSVIRCRPSDKLNRAAQLMWEYDCGALPVVDADDRVVGMITDRDICMACYIQGRSLSEPAVADVMSRDVVSCSEDASLEEVARLMRQRRVRRLPVISDEGLLAGTIALADFALHADAFSSREHGQELLQQTLKAVCAPRSARSGEAGSEAAE